MTEPNENLIPNGNEINLKHFIYLDRERLTSYSSQLSDGIVQLRRLTENISNLSVDTPLEQYEEETTEKGNETEISVGPKAHAGGVSVKNTAKNNKRRGFKTGGTTITDESSQSFGEDKIDHDNAYLLLEERLIQENLLCEISKISQLEQYSPLIKIRGTARFFDWNSFKDLIININDVLPCFDEETRKIFQGKQGKQNVNLFKRIFNTFSIGTLTVHTHIEQSGVIASLNPDYLCMTREQLRATYVMPGDVEITIVGFHPKRISIDNSFTGIAGTMDLLPYEVYHGRLSEGSHHVWIVLDNDELKNFDQSEIELISEKLGSQPQSHILLDVSKTEGSQELAMNFIDKLSNRWHCVICDAQDNILSIFFSSINLGINIHTLTKA